MSNVIRMNEVGKRYGAVTALDGVTFELAENRIHGLLGRNGAGKTTVMQILTAQAFETSGTVEVFGRHPYEDAEVLSRICFVREGQQYPDWFEVRHVLRAAAILYPDWDAEFAADLMGEFALPAGRRVKKLSRGMLSAVGVVVGLAARAPLTFFDEPYLGLDAAARQLFYDRLLADYAARPRTVVLSTHLIDEVSDLIEHVVVLDRGRVLFDDDAEALRGRAVTVSGPVRAVDAFVAGRGVLHREEIAGVVRVTVAGVPDRPTADGLRFEPVSLQQLVVRSTQGGAEGRPIAAGAVRGGAR